MKSEHHLIDGYFAKKCASDSTDEVLEYLADLLRAARLGHLCLPVNPDLSLPNFLFDQILVQSRGHIYLKRNWECEKLFTDHVRRLLEHEPSIPIPKLSLPNTLEFEQKTAIYHAARYALSLICGGPGTGKTFTAATLIRHFIPHLNEVIVAAPTGKAAANLRLSLHGICEVKTLHALLRKKKLREDLVLVDEASMIDAELMACLFSAIKTGARLILIGDQDQLPPVESGHFFTDLVRQQQHVTFLKKCLRTELHEIVEMAEAVKKGEMIPSHPLPTFEQIAKSVFMHGVRILTPLKKGAWGAQRLNEKLFQADIAKGGTRFPIMITVNEPAIDLYNGDLGVWDQEKKCAYFGEREVPQYLLPHFEYAYVLSIHKSQGSEYDEVMVLLPPGSEIFGREVVYTAITRAKKGIKVCAPEGMLEQILSKKEQRLSGISRIAFR